MVVAALPIPTEEYDGFLKQIAHLGIGDPLAQDCKVENILDGLPVLDCLLEQNVNIDEIDFLAKRLERLSEDEKTQFQAMAHVMNLTEPRSLINLTFSIGNVTVIRDFTDLEQVGKAHFLHTSDDDISPEIMRHVNGTQIAKDLLEKQNGLITPYGITYPNGMELLDIYHGGNFPQYQDGESVLVGTVSRREKLSAPSEYAWLYFPTSKNRMERTLIRGGLDKDATLFLRLECCQEQEETAEGVGGEILDAIGCDWKINPGDSLLAELNTMCRAVAPLSENERQKLSAVIEYAKPQEIRQITQLAKHLGEFDFIPGAQEPEDYARHIIMESGEYDCDARLEPYINFELFAQSCMPPGGEFTQRGYVEYMGMGTLEAIMTPELPGQEAEPARQTQQGRPHCQKRSGKTKPER